MRRIPGLLLLLAVALPYARAPMCEADAHEHHHGSVHTVEAPEHGAETAIDCHALMGCGTVLVATDDRLADQVRRHPARTNATAPDVRCRAAPFPDPESPPPKLV